jgi:predicted phosphoribosyltransferase
MIARMTPERPGLHFWRGDASPRFASREDAAGKLAAALQDLKGSKPLVLAIPRGAVGMGAVIANALEGDLDVVLIRKLRAPGNPEYAIGSIDESGWTYLTAYARAAGADDAYIEQEKAEQLALLRHRRAMYTPDRAPHEIAGRIVVVVDDGLATGASMIAALHAVRSRAPKRLVCAVPVAAPDSLSTVTPYADEVVCLAAPSNFRAVGQFYEQFEQVDDEEVVRVLRGSRGSASRR